MNRSEKLFKKACGHLPGGVSSPVRAFRGVGGTPPFIERGKGAYLWDADGKKYLDFVMSWGPLILGHASPAVVSAVEKQAKLGTSFGAPTENEIRLAELVKLAFPSINLVRFVSSGTEAVMSAIRLARGITGKNRIVKCDGCYHGHADSLLVKAGSGVATFGIPDSKGVPPELAQLTTSIPFNDLDALERTLKRYKGEVACFLVEPIPANMGVILPKVGYLTGARQLTKRYGVLLIFDEVISGFRAALGGAQELFGITPDLTCLGKILGGGLPIGAFGGRSELMKHLAPEGPVYQAGTLSGNPLATASGIATLSQLKKKSFYAILNKKADSFLKELSVLIHDRKLPVTLNRIGSLFTVFFTEGPVVDYASAKTSDTTRYARFFHELLKHGIYSAPSQFEANFISSAHTPADLNRSTREMSKALEAVYERE